MLNNSNQSITSFTVNINSLYSFKTDKMIMSSKMTRVKAYNDVFSMKFFKIKFQNFLTVIHSKLSTNTSINRVYSISRASFSAIYARRPILPGGK